jgi:citrate synthase
MTMMTVTEASRRLGVKPATLYAYVSRGLLHSRRGSDGRGTLFNAADIEKLARRGRPRRARNPPFELQLETAITEITPGDARYRGHSSSALAAEATFEQVAELLWTATLGDYTAWPEAHVDLGVDIGGIERMRAVLAVAAAADPLRIDLDPATVIRRGRVIVSALVDGLSAPGRVPVPRWRLRDTDEVMANTIAGRLWARLGRERPRPGALVALNAALVLLADHEFATSTIAARVAASTRADPYAVVGAALGAVSGPLHGGASRVTRLMIEAAATVGPEVALADAMMTYGAYPGFGQRASARLGFGQRPYPGADPRVVALLPFLRDVAGRAGAASVLDELAEVARVRVGGHPNVDFAVAGLGYVVGLPVEAGDVVFAVARSAGWIAHTIEEYQEAPLRFRPRTAAFGQPEPPGDGDDASQE